MEIIEQFKDTVFKRLRGAFGGTFILVWLALNWRVIFIIFSLDKEMTLDNRLYRLTIYKLNHYPGDLIWWPLLFSLVSIGSYSLLNLIANTIISFFNLKLWPEVLKMIDKNRIIEKSEFDKVEKRYFDLVKKYTDERGKFAEADIEIERLVKDISAKEVALDESKKAHSIDIRQKEELLQEHRKTEEETKEFYQNQTKALQGINTSPAEMFPGEWQKLFTVGEITTPELFKIRNSDYFVVGEERPSFKFQYIKKFNDGEYVTLKKISPKNNNVLENKLVKISDNQYIGYETGKHLSDIIPINYRRIR